MQIMNSLALACNWLTHSFSCVRFCASASASASRTRCHTAYHELHSFRKQATSPRNFSSESPVTEFLVLPDSLRNYYREFSDLAQHLARLGTPACPCLCFRSCLRLKMGPVNQRTSLEPRHDRKRGLPVLSRADLVKPRLASTGPLAELGAKKLRRNLARSADKCQQTTPQSRKQATYQPNAED